jgi:hypothetical protein
MTDQMKRASIRASSRTQYYRPNSRFYHEGVATCHACNEIAHLPDTGCMSCGSDNVTHHRTKARARHRATKTFRVRMERITFPDGRVTLKAYESGMMKESEWIKDAEWTCRAITIQRFIRTYEIA